MLASSGRQSISATDSQGGTHASIRYIFEGKRSPILVTRPIERVILQPQIMSSQSW